MNLTFFIEVTVKINGQHPKLPTQESHISAGKERSQIAQDKAANLKNMPILKGSDKFAVNRIRSKIDSEPDIDSAKVKALKEKIQSGEYKVNTEQLAKNLLKDSILEDF